MYLYNCGPSLDNDIIGKSTDRSSCNINLVNVDLRSVAQNNAR